MTSIDTNVTTLLRNPDRRVRLPHRWILGCVVLASLLFYAETTARFGHALAVADAHLYYTHAHSWYFDGDCDYENNIAENQALEVREYYLAQRSPGGMVVNVFPCGWSLVAMPFLAVADGLTAVHNALLATQIPRDGHSVYYRAIVPLGHVLVGLAGMLAGYAVAARYFSKVIAASAIAIVWIGTNASYFVSVEPTLSHAASLGFVTLMILAGDTIHRDGWSLPRALGLGLACGMMMAIRHQNVAWLVVPLILLAPGVCHCLWNGKSGRLRPQSGFCRSVTIDHRASSRFRELKLCPIWFRPLELPLIAVLAAVLCLTPQIGVNLATHGSIFGALPGYLPHWFHPAIARELFTNPTGLFILYPLSAVCVVGVIGWGWQYRHLALPRALVAGTVAILYINACASFGPPRRYACCFTIFVLGLAAIIHWSRQKSWRFVLVWSIVGVVCARNVALLFLADRCLVDRDLFTASPTSPLDIIAGIGQLMRF